MAYAFVQQNPEASTNASGQSSIVSGAFGASLTAGNLLVCHVWYTGAASPLTVTLSGGSSPTWNAETVVNNGNEHLHSWYAMNIPGGVTTQVTATFSGGTADFPFIYVAEYSGFATTGARLAFAAQHQASPGTGTDGVTSGLLGTLASQPAGIIALTFNENSDGTPTAGTSFTSLTAVGTYAGTVSASARPEHRRVTSTASVAGTFTTAVGTSPHKTAAWAFAESGGGGGGGNVTAWLRA